MMVTLTNSLLSSIISTPTSHDPQHCSSYLCIRALTCLTLKTSVIPASSKYSWASRDTDFSTTTMFGWNAAILATLFFRNSLSYKTTGSTCGASFKVILKRTLQYLSMIKFLSSWKTKTKTKQKTHPNHTSMIH